MTTPSKELIHKDDVLDVMMGSPNPEIEYNPVSYEAPPCFSQTMDQLYAHFSLFEELLNECKKKSLDVQTQLPDLARLYQKLVQDAN